LPCYLIRSAVLAETRLGEAAPVTKALIQGAVLVVVCIVQLTVLPLIETGVNLYRRRHSITQPTVT
jgi:hypothetical protein